jgi:hypothetical protein
MRGSCHWGAVCIALCFLAPAGCASIDPNLPEEVKREMQRRIDKANEQPEPYFYGGPP